MITSGGGRDLDEIRIGIEAWCARDRPDLSAAGIEELEHAAAGMSNETVIVEFRPTRDDAVGERLVVRLPPVLSTLPDQDFLVQAHVQAALAATDVPTAVPIAVEADTSLLGVPFIVMPFVEGTVPGQASLYDPWLLGASEQQRRGAQREMIRILAQIQRVDWHKVGLDALMVGPHGSLAEQLRWWDGYLRWAMSSEPMPRIEAILDWCHRHQPSDDAPPSLVWGDPRLGNLVMDDQRRTRAVLDWELATIGPPEMDLGWYLGLERVLLDLVDEEPLDGMAGHDEVAADYEQSIGRPLDDLAWHEIFAVFRSIAITVRQATISAEAGVDYLLAPGEANPLVAIVERWIGEHPSG